MLVVSAADVGDRRDDLRRQPDAACGLVPGGVEGAMLEQATGEDRAEDLDLVEPCTRAARMRRERPVRDETQIADFQPAE